MSDTAPYLCPGCNVREPFEHRCHHDDGAWMGDPPCECPECNPKDKPSGLKITFNPFSFDHETNMKFLAKGYEPVFTVPLDRP